MVLKQANLANMTLPIFGHFLSPFARTMEDLQDRACNQVVWNMVSKKRTPVKKPKRPPPKKLKMSAKGGHDRSFQKRMEIAILASRGVKPAEIVKAVGCTFDMAIRWSDQSEEVMQTGSVQSKRKGKEGSKSIFATPSAKKKHISNSRN